MIPCQDAGLSFKNGDVLQIVEQDDPNWWQVRNLKSNLPLKKMPISLPDLMWLNCNLHVHIGKVNLKLILPAVLPTLGIKKIASLFSRFFGKHLK